MTGKNLVHFSQRSHERSLRKSRNPKIFRFRTLFSRVIYLTLGKIKFRKRLFIPVGPKKVKKSNNCLLLYLYGIFTISMYLDEKTTQQLQYLTIHTFKASKQIRFEYFYIEYRNFNEWKKRR